MKKFNLIKKLLAMMLILVASINTAWANYAYMDLTGFTSWYEGSAWFRLNLNSTSVDVDSKTEIGSTGVWRFNIGGYTGNVTYKRMQPNTTNQWNYYNGSISATQNVARISGWNSGSMQTSFVIDYIHGTNQVYFDNSVSNFPNNIYFVIGHDYSPSGGSSLYTKTYKMSQVTGTKLYHVEVTDTWEDATYFAVIADDAASISAGSWGSSSLGTSNKGDKGYTAAYKSVYNMEGGTYLITTASSGNNKAMTITYYDGYSSLPQVSATQAAKKRDTGTTYSTITGSNSWPATLKLKGSYMKNATDTARSTLSSTTANDGNRVYGAIKTGTITQSYASLSSSFYFEGWGTGSTPTNTGATNEYQITAATTVYAFFSKLYTLDFDCKGTYGGSTVSASVANYTSISSGDKVPTGHTITVTASPATGYEVAGWYSDASCSSAYTNGSGGVTISGSGNVTFTLASLNANAGIYCKFQKKTYSITLNDDGDYDGDGSATVQYGDAALTVVSHASRTDWNLLGYWNTSAKQVTDAEGNLLTSVASYTDASGHWIYDGDVTLYAHWSQSYTVTYNANGGTGTTTDASSPYEVGSDVTVLSNSFTRSGYSFTGWNTSAEGDGTPYAAGATISSIAANVTLYAQWSENDYTVTVNAGSNGSVASGSVTGHKDTKVTLPTATANTGYHFDTWTTTSGSVTYTNQTSATSAQVNGLTAAATVRADFAANTYSVVFNANGGTGSMSNEAFTYDAASKALTSNSFTKSGYTFVGWATSADRANAMNIDYTNGQSVQNLTSTNGGTFNLYAVWAKKYYIGGRFQHDWVDGTSTANEMTYDASTGYYKFTTSKTVSELSAQWHNVSGNYDADQVFFIHTGNGKVGSSSNPFYTTPNEDGAGLNFETSNSYANALVLANQETTWGEIVTNRLVQFSNKDNLSSNVIVWWEPATKKVWYTATESLNTNYYLLGFGSDSWGETDARRFKVASVNATTATVEVSLSAQTYTQNTNDGFKVKHHDGTFYGNNGTMERAHCSGWVFESDKQNCGITADLAGTYTFTLNLNTKAVSVTYPTAYQLNYSIGSVAGTDGSISTSPSTSSGSYVGSGNSVTLTGPAAKTGYTWKGWYTNAAGTEGKIADESRAITVTMNADKTLYACYTENSYSTNVAVSPASTGSITTPTPADGKIDVSHHTGTSVTATANTNYVFDHWGVSGGGLTVSSTTANPATFNATSANGTITAYFEDQWCIKGDQWDSWSTSKGLPNTGTNTYSASFTLTKGQKYKFKVHDRKTNTWYGNAKDAGEQAMERGDAAYTTTSGSGVDDNLTITPDVTGTYTFSFNTSTKALTVTFPTAYTVTYGVGTINGSNSAISVSPSFTSGDYVLPETDITFSKGDTKDGYTWKGWYSDQAGSATLHEDDDDDFTWSATRTGNISVYACYNFITYDITYNLNGGSNPVDPAPASSFNVETSTITLPTPTRTGYTFNGWYANSDLSTGGVKTQIAKGTMENQEFWAKWTANDYTITLNQNGATTDSDPTSLTATYDATAPEYDDGAKAYKFDITNPAKTGYTFAGWFESVGGTGAEIITTYGFFKHEDNPYVDGTGHWKQAGDVTVYAKWTPNNYAVTLSTSGETGYGSSAPSNQTATYGAAMPTITPPVGAPGYKFMGYFLGQNGTGAQYYDASGASAINWNRAEATTLYAYFRKTEISSLTHPAAVAKGDVVYVVVDPVFNQTGAQNYMAICWSLLYDNNNPVESGWTVESYTEEGTKPNQVRFTLTSMASGYYQIKAVLKASASSGFDACSTGTELSTVKSNLTVAGNSTVTIQYEDASGNKIAANTSVEVARGDSIGIKAPSIIGYAFDEWVLGDVLSSSCRNAATCGLDKDSINIKAAYDGYLTAKYTKKQMIYFNNTLDWDTVYVYFYSNSNYWGGDNQGTGADVSYHGSAYTGKHGGMTKIAGTNIYYFDLAANSVSTSLTNVAFTEKDQNGAGYFYANNVIGRGDYSGTLSMYVPLAGVDPVTKNGTGEYMSNYYEKGYWLNYPESTGYTLKIYDNTGGGAKLVKERDFAFPANKAMPMPVTVDLEGGNKTYGFKIYRADGTWFSNGGTMTNGHSGDVGQAAWAFGSEVLANCGLTTTSAGNYTFTLSFNSDGNHQVGVHYPEGTGDFRVMYIDDVRITNHGGAGNEGKSWLLSSVIPGNTASDTISYFVRAEGGKHPKFKIQKCTVSEEAREEDRTVGWADQGTAINVPDSITENGVYNFIFAKDNGSLVLQKIEPYEGNFYIRVDGAGSSNWDNFRAADHLMPYSDYSFNQTENPYSHYFTQWYKVEKVGGDVKVKNIKFVVANDYSVCVSDTIVKDGVADAYVDANGYITRSANIRFMYNYKTNEATRRYVDGAQEYDSEFLMIIPGNSKTYAAAEGGDPLTQLTFSDKGNWIYEAEVYALPTATYKLKSKFGATASGDVSQDWERKGVITQYFKGSESTTETLIGGNPESDTRVKIRLLYDFKTNRVVAAYQPSSGTIATEMAINADIMFMREHQGDIEQITFSGEDAKIKDIKNIYCSLKFNKYTLNNLSKDEPHGLLPSLLSRYERDIFYVSFPYDVRLSDVIGFGTYGQHWIIEYYDGAARAKNGFWSDSESYWKFVTPAMKDTFTLKAGTGYIVALDLDEMWYLNDTYHADIWNNTAEVELLFPGDVNSISNQAVTYNMPSHECTINRGTTAGNRTKKDSHWNVLGVPTFKNIRGEASGEPDEGVGSGEIRFANVALLDTLVNDLKFIYDGNLADNSLTPKAVKDFEFKAMHAYVVQYCGDVTFTTSATPAPAIIARRTYAEAPQEVDFRLELTKDGVMEDQTFISLSNDENVSADFEFGEDLSKEFNTNRANIYTFIGTEWVAGNTLPMSEQTTVVPVGVKTAADGDYTFAMPEGTSGVGVTLVDTETGIRTSLSALEYTVNLEAGTYDNRFYLEISPIVQNPTDIENVQGDNVQGTKVRKVMVDGILYIVKDGKMFDAQGRQVK